MRFFFGMAADAPEVTGRQADAMSIGREDGFHAARGSALSWCWFWSRRRRLGGLPPA